VSNRPRKRRVWGNRKVFDRDGNLIFTCHDRKADWYLDKGLAERLSHDPLAIRLNFQTNGPGHRYDQGYFLEEKKNICVVCGSEGELNTHHVVPWCYRRYFPDELKTHNWYDIMALCIPCHNNYERFAWELKLEIAEEFNIPVDGKGMRKDKAKVYAMKIALTIQKHGNKIPEVKLRNMKDILREYLQKQDITQEDINQIAELKIDFWQDYVPHGQYVVKRLSDTEGFVRRWRKHFVDTMQPKFISENWKIEESIYRSH